MSKGSPSRRFRLDDNELWEAYAELCAEEDTDRSADLREYVRRRVAEWRARQDETG